jgi:Tol biopolymer transport system component
MLTRSRASLYLIPAVIILLAVAQLSCQAVALYAPWPCGQSWHCTQGNGGAFSHTGSLQYAWDFKQICHDGGGYPFVASASGTVVMAKQTADDGFGTTMVVDHGDGTYARYGHAVEGSLTKGVGDHVTKGDELGIVGCTGLCTGHHLHFQLQDGTGASIPAVFADIGNPPDPPGECSDEAYTSGNCGPPANPGVTTRVSLAGDGNERQGGSYGACISADGRYVAYQCFLDLPEMFSDVIIRDLYTGENEVVSITFDGSPSGCGSSPDGISADGRYVAFTSCTGRILPGKAPGVWPDGFVRDRLVGQTFLVTVAADGTWTEEGGGCGSISADGRYVAFWSYASNLVPGDTNGYPDVFVRDQQAGQTTRVSVSSAGTQANSNSGSGSISADGRYVAFDSDASNLVPGDTNGMWDVFVHDRQTGQTTRVSLASDGTQGNSGSRGPSISADGRYVAFWSYASNLVPGDTNGKRDVFVHDRQTGQTTRFSVASDGTQGNGDSRGPSISADGRYLAFTSEASTLVPGDTSGGWDVFLHDRQTGQTTRVSVASDGTQGNGDSGFYGAPSSISADGRYVAFVSYASNLVPGDTNGCEDVFVHDCWGNGTPPPPDSGPGWDPPPSTSFEIRSPYADYAPVRRLKGQLHSHYFNDGPTSWGSITPERLIEDYADQLGYDFVCVTEHYHCTTDPLVYSPECIRYCEEVTKDFAHVLALHINHSRCPDNSSGPGGDESRYGPWDSEADTNGLCEVEQFSSGNLQEVVGTIGDWGGLAILAHPDGPAAPDLQSLLDVSSLTAVSVYTAANNWPIVGGLYYAPGAVGTWDWLLAMGKETSTPSGPQRVFCATEDDFTPRICYGAFGRTWIVVDVTDDTPTQIDILDAIKRGRYWAYWAKSRHNGTGPLLTLSVDTSGTTPVINVTSDTTLDEIKFYGATDPPREGPLPGGSGSGSSASYTCNGTEKYVRVEARKGDVHIYSQAISIDWNTGTGGLAAKSGIPTRNTLGTTPADIVYTCASPQDLPANMPPLGYIGRAYSVSTTSGTYPLGSTLTLSYEGIDATPYGTSNLAIYRWDAATTMWARQLSTVDIGNALVTAPLAQAGLYTISAEVAGDITDPTVTIHTPSSGATLTGTDVIGVRAYDNVGVLRTSFYLNDQCIGTDSTSFDGYTCEFDFGKKSAGPYTLKVVAEDVTGNTGEAQVSINISSSDVTPTVTITSPSSGAELTGTATITGTCGDNSLVAGVFILADGIPVGEAHVTGGNWTFDLDTTQLANGPHALSAQVLDDDQNTCEQGVSVTISGPTLGSLAEAKSVADGGQARLSGRVVTFGAPGYDGAFWIEEQDRFAGLRIQGSLLPSEGDMVSASGVMSTLEGERMLVGADVLRISASNPLPKPIGVMGRFIGGAAVGWTPGVSGWQHLSNVGLLVAVWGRVTVKGADYLYVDDGARLRDGTLTGEEENVGVRVICDPSSYTAGDFLIVTGISSCFETPAGEIARRILTRKPEDIRKVYP